MIEILLLGALTLGMRQFWNKDKTSSVSVDRSATLAQVFALMHRAGLVPEDIAQGWKSAPATIPEPKRETHEIGSQIFAYLGAVFVIAGLGTLISEFWAQMGASLHVMVTLGVGILLHFVSIIAMREDHYPRAVVPLVLAAAAMQIIGWFVLIYEVFPHGSEPQKAILAVFGILTVQYAATFARFRRTILAFCAIVFLYGFLQAALDLAGMDVKYIALLLGTSAFLLANGLFRTPHQSLTLLGYMVGGLWLDTGIFLLIEDATSHPLSVVASGGVLLSQGYALQCLREHKFGGMAYLFGSLMLFAGLFDLLRGTSFELVYFGVAIGMIYVCTILQSRVLLLTSICALLGYIGYYTRQYFLDSLGWPVALMIMGLAFLAVGMLAVRVKRKFGAGN